MHYRIASVAALALILSACSTPQHTNLLIFGTNTVVGLKVGADATQTPAIQLAYSRQELVLMPLLANTSLTGDKLAPCPSTVVDQTPPPTVPVNCKFIGEEGQNNTDSYSVLASFGAKFDAKKVGTEAQAGGAIAQYFATGLAARQLAKHGSSLVAASESATAEASGVSALRVDISYAAQVASNLANSPAVTDDNFAMQLGKLDTAVNSSPRFVDACNGLTTKLACSKEIEKFQQPALVTMPGRIWPLAAAYKFQ